MNKSIKTIFVTIGTVIGSGFMSGKEIVVFFSRFGYMSFVGIFLAFFMFWGLFYFFLTQGSEAVNNLKNSKLANSLNIIICLILVSAMFAGSIDVASFSIPIEVIIIVFIFISCFFITRNGLGSLEKLNFVMVPLMIIVLVICVCELIVGGKMTLSSPVGYASIYYSLMYVILNTANSGIVIAHMGKQLSAKQKARVSFISALVLCCILLLGNIVLLQNKEVFIEDMPLLSLFKGGQRIVMQLVILLGCLTTLFALVYSMSQSLRGLIKNQNIVYLLSVLLPFVIAQLGFGFIVSHLYPLTSVLGASLLFLLFFKPFFKKAYKSVHYRSKNTK